MTNLRPGLGSCTPNWGTHDDRVSRLSSEASTSPVSLRHLSDPVTIGLAPGPVTEDLHRTQRSPSRLLHHGTPTWIAATTKRLWRPDDRVKTN